VFYTYSGVLVQTLRNGTESILEGQKNVADEEAVVVTDLREANVAKTNDMLKVMEEYTKLGWFRKDVLEISPILRELRDMNYLFARAVIAKIPPKCQSALKKNGTTQRKRLFLLLLICRHSWKIRVKSRRNQVL
jgi:hypothetical protein